ncbi:MAG: hypothetical protein ACI9P3_004209 [Bradyrhizobium sp.]|jgi:hypothetical protein
MLRRRDSHSAQKADDRNQPVGDSNQKSGKCTH